MPVEVRSSEGLGRTVYSGCVVDAGLHQMMHQRQPDWHWDSLLPPCEGSENYWLVHLGEQTSVSSPPKDRLPETEEPTVRTQATDVAK